MAETMPCPFPTGFMNRGVNSVSNQEVMIDGVHQTCPLFFPIFDGDLREKSPLVLQQFAERKSATFHGQIISKVSPPSHVCWLSFTH